MNTPNSTKLMKKSVLAVGIALAVASTSSQAISLYEEDGTTLDFNGLGLIGTFSSEETYGNADQSPAWQEAAFTYGLYGNTQLEDNSVYGGLAAITTWVGGDGSADGASTGNESSKTDIEEAFVGIAGTNWDFSLGKQGFKIGSGFIIWDDGLNLGEGFVPDFNRGGTYYLGGGSRKSFENTAILRLGGEQGVRSDIFWLKSDNVPQNKMELAGINIEHNSEIGTFGATYIKGLDVDTTFGGTNRDGQQTLGFRYEGNAGVENLFLASEYVTQDSGDNSADGNAWYAEAGWTFADTPWAPIVNYRYSSFDENYDLLFVGAGRGYGTWFQGEVASNYAGNFHRDTDVHHLSVIAHPSETLRVGTSYFKFTDTRGGTGSNDADEINVWAEWVAADNLIISPLVSFYTPESASSTQGNDDTNTYFQLLAIVPF